MTDQVQKPEYRPPDTDTLQGSILGWLEVIILCAVTLGAICVAVYLAFWIIFGYEYCNGSHERLVGTIRGMHENWRVSLLLLVVLFFRPMRKFLMNLKEGPFGIKIGEPLDQVAKSNPTTEPYSISDQPPKGE